MDYPRGKTPGIYFGLDEQEYHDDPALSHSGIKQLNDEIEEFTYHKKCFNPDAPEFVDTDATRFGSMMHMRLLQPELFDKHYAREPSAEEYTAKGYTVVNTVGEWKQKLDERGIDYPASAQAARLQSLSPEDIIYLKPVIADAKAKAEQEGKESVNQNDWETMIMAEERIRNHPKFSQYFVNGIPEVSIFWDDPETGIPLKCRIDWLKVDTMIDYKSFNKAMSKSLVDAMHSAIKFRHYDLQAVMYTLGRLEIAKVIAASWDEDKGWWGAVHGDVSKEFITDFLACKDPSFGFVFQRNSKPCSLRGRSIPVRRDSTNAWGQGMQQYLDGLSTYAQGWQKYGLKHWVHEGGIVPLQDHDIYYG